MPHALFHIPKDIITPHINDSQTFKWNKYDESCQRTTITIPPNIVKDIYAFTDLPNTSINDQYLAHYIKYNITNEYQIDPHYDSCRVTIIIYLRKNKSIKDSFYVDNKRVDNCWSNKDDTYGCLVMWREPGPETDEQFVMDGDWGDDSDDTDWHDRPRGPHHFGNFTGVGRREVLCIFLYI